MKYLEGIQGNYELILKCWAAIPSTFLTGLLRAKSTNTLNAAQSNEEAQIKFELGVTALHTFASLLSQDRLEELFPRNVPSKSQRLIQSRVEEMMVEVPMRYLC